MKTVQAIVEHFGGLKYLDEHVIRVECPGYMRLVIEGIGQGPRELPAVSIAHYYEQNGDLMRDPEMCFEITPSGEWFPYYYLQDNLGIEQEVFVRMENRHLGWRSKLHADLFSFSRQWDRNLKEQGFLKAALAMTPEVDEPQVKPAPDLIELEV